MAKFRQRKSSNQSDARVALPDTSFRLVAEAQSLQRDGKDVAILMLGETDFDTPSRIIEKAKWAQDNGFTRYTPSAGLDDVRELYADYVRRQYNVEGITGKNIVIQPGGSMVCFITLLALVHPGDEVIITDPTFPVYEHGINRLGGSIRRLPLYENKGWGFDHDKFKSLISEKTRLVIINSPQNPTGGVFTTDDLNLIAELGRVYGYYVLSDEIYNRFTYDDEHSSFLHIPDILDQTILLDGHSKTYAMTGWRLAFSVTGVELAEKFTDLMTLLNCNTASFTQVAGAEALCGDQRESEIMVDEFRCRRDMVCEGLGSIEGLSFVKPSGAFYVFINAKSITEHTGMTSSELVRCLMHRYGVGLLPGTIFGPSGEGYIRLSYAADRETLGKGVEKLDLAFRELRR